MRSSTSAGVRVGLAPRLMLAQVLVLGASVITAGLVAAFVGPPLFHHHMLQAGHGPNTPELAHIEEAYRAASFVSLGVALVIALVCAAAVTWYVTRRLQAPLGALSRAAREVSRGHLGARVGEFGSGAEFEELGRAFNLMATQLEQTEDTRRRLLSDLAHELRTPIATLTIYCEGLRDGVTTWDDDTERVMTQQTQRLARLAADLDDVSRAEEGRLALERSPTSVRDLLWSAGQARREAFAREGIEFIGEVEECPDVDVDVDPRRMGQVLDNLLANALRHTHHGGSVRLSAQVVADAVEISVSDTGDGIPAEQLPHVFERFYRGDTARDRDRGGSGLGLTISRAIADAHQGSLVASSPGPGKGSTFTLSLPVFTRLPH
ncbi:HAMP domain-containing histidine kinase [Intrasporangium calvum]|uniref:histidine kinase n=1 Tax=Intrasporangium calvum TaxID=53358 RepID=A0ABT5GG31_9MICO|nr:HAMP domain-containing sensor histidine kinase [Intrasporangium calvum]MDC5696855.1 HAMP domain-containing histidine kinase [Intrasporangium calvum]